MKSRPLSTEYASYYEKYVSQVPDGDILTILRDQLVTVDELFGRVAAKDELFRYGPDKWTFREVAGHLIDAERVFGLRAFCFSRGEQAPLPSFDENAYVGAGNANDVSLRDLVAEFRVVRQGNLHFLTRLNDAQWVLQGTASGKTVTVRGLGWIMAGHVLHHCAILTERYHAALRS
jgi:hypothetical protein